MDREASAVMGAARLAATCTQRLAAVTLVTETGLSGAVRDFDGYPAPHQGEREAAPKYAAAG